MSSFWNSGGEDVRQKIDYEADLPTGEGFEPLPDKTKVLALVTEAGIGEKDGDRYAFATLEIIKPAAYAKRKLFPRFWVYDDNPHAADKEKKRANDLKRFIKLDGACGGKLARKDGVPSNDDIALAFTGKQVIVQVMLMTPRPTEQNPKPDSVQWFADYWAKGQKEVPEVEASSKKVTKKPEYADDLDDDSAVPF